MKRVGTVLPYNTLSLSHTHILTLAKPGEVEVFSCTSCGLRFILQNQHICQLVRATIYWVHNKKSKQYASSSKNFYIWFLIINKLYYNFCQYYPLKLKSSKESIYTLKLIFSYIIILSIWSSGGNKDAFTRLYLWSKMSFYMFLFENETCLGALGWDLFQNEVEISLAVKRISRKKWHRTSNL